jgi:hypothetical protein
MNTFYKKKKGFGGRFKLIKLDFHSKFRNSFNRRASMHLWERRMKCYKNIERKQKWILYLF